MQNLRTIDFIILCNDAKKEKTLDFCLEQINNLSTAETRFKKIRAILVPVGENSEYLRLPTTKKHLNSKFENIEIRVPNGKTINSTEPRAWNYGLYTSLTTGDPTYISFLYETDVIQTNKLLSYYMWLFESSHNPDVVGAVTISDNVGYNRIIPQKIKMWYADDIKLRGSCYKTEALRLIGPFDESLIYYSYQFDYSSRLTHHCGYLCRIGKDDNTFIKFGPENLTENHNKISILKKQSFVWYSRKWSNKGIIKGVKKGTIPTTTLRHNTFTSGEEFTVSKFKDQLKIDETGTRNRISYIIEDMATIKAIEVSKSFMKKPYGKFQTEAIYRDGICIHNNNHIQTHINCVIEYPELLWKMDPKY